MAATMYMKYIVADQVMKAFEQAGAKLSHVTLHDTALVSVTLDDWYVDSTYTWVEEEQHAKLRAERERIIVELLELLPGSYADRDANKITLYYSAWCGVKAIIHIGEALCERVKVGETTVEKIDPDYLAAAPKVTVVEEQFEWRCSDDILGSMKHKAGA